MVFGKTDQQRRREHNLEVIRMAEGERCFAWLPVQLANGTFVWLQHYWRYYRFRIEPGERIELDFRPTRGLDLMYTAHLNQDRAHINGTGWSTDAEGADALESFKEKMR